jgi:hypothetical protein
LTGPIDGRLDEQAAHAVDFTPAVAQASAGLDRARQARSALDTAVDEAGRRRDEALVVARCEYHPSPQCPQTHITGVPGTGPETRTADDFLADTQRELDTVTADRDRRAPALESEIGARERALVQARTDAMTSVDRGIGPRWTAMNAYTMTSPGALLLRLLTIVFCTLPIALPLILRLWRGETSSDRGSRARDEVERAEIEADTAIAVKRAEVRAAVETLWAEQQLASARLAAQAQTEIDREQQRRRVVEALEEPVQVHSERPAEEMDELPAAESIENQNLPARIESTRDSLIPTIPDVTKAAARWLRPFVPPIVATAIETTTKPLRTVRQVFEESEEIHISLRRTHKVTVESQEAEETASEVGVENDSAPVSVSAVRHHAVTGREAHSALRQGDDRRQLPPSVGQ